MKTAAISNFAFSAILCLFLQAGIEGRAALPDAPPGIGTVWAWGNNSSGQLGLGDTSNRSTPVAAHFPVEEGEPPVNIVAIATGGGSVPHSLALDSEGNVWAWGSNSQGQVAIPRESEDSPSPSRSTTPSRVIFPERQDGSPVKIMAIAAASSGGRPGVDSNSDGHSLALDTEGTVWAWGANSRGQLGDGTTLATRMREPVVRVLMEGGEAPLGNIVAIAADNLHSMALDAEGNVWVWGSNIHGQLGIPGTEMNMSSFPVRVQFPELEEGAPVKIQAIATGQFHLLALDNGGNLWAWGHNSRGQLGDGTMALELTGTENDNPTPQLVHGPGGEGLLGQGLEVVAVAGGLRSSYVVDASGNAWSWGINVFGQLGDGTQVDRAFPGPILEPREVLLGFDLRLISIEEKSDLPAEGVSAVYAAQDSSGQVYFRIFDEHGVQVADLTEEDIEDERELQMLKNRLGRFWGQEEFTLPEKSLLIPLIAITADYTRVLEDVSLIESSDIHALACSTDGTIWAWGANNDGQLGTGDHMNRPTPGKVLFPEEAPPRTVLALAAGYLFSMALTTFPESPVALAFERTANKTFVLTWNQNDAGGQIILEQSSDLAPGSWTAVAIHEAGRHEITPDNGGARFFRLRQQAEQ
jgi:alpha-tubulin suppressor-like RCC1 family protein